MSKLVTKYFSHEAKKFIETGSFRFGSLEKYRTGEQGQSRFTDLSEGKGEVHLQTDRGEYKNVSMNGITIGTFVNNLGPFTLIASPISFNELVFCVSNHGYVKEHHYAIRDGHQYDDGSSYHGNPELNCYAVIDLPRLLDLLQEILPEKSYWQLGAVTQQNLMSAEVTYRNRVHFTEATNNYFYADGEVLESFNSIVFSKPDYFSMEEELRVVMRPRFPQGLPSGIDFIDVESPRLKDCIVEMQCIDSRP